MTTELKTVADWIDKWLLLTNLPSGDRTAQLTFLDEAQEGLIAALQYYGAVRWRGEVWRLKDPSRLGPIIHSPGGVSAHELLWPVPKPAPPPEPPAPAPPAPVTPPPEKVCVIRDFEQERLKSQSHQPE